MKTPLQAVFVTILIIGLSSCQSFGAPKDREALHLASAEENGVKVVVSLAHTGNEQDVLSATFIPLEPGLHLYSKNIPKNGVENLGRPTLLELMENSKLKPLGELQESAPAQAADFAPQDLLVYPPGEVTLSLPVALPPGDCWLDESVIVTYMACSDTGCRPPVVGKHIDVHLPCSDAAID